MRLQLRGLRRRDLTVYGVAEPGRDAVDRHAAVEDVAPELTARFDRVTDTTVARQRDRRAAAGDGDDVVEGEVGAVDDDGPGRRRLGLAFEELRHVHYGGPDRPVLSTISGDIETIRRQEAPGWPI
jgi:hypothetical protein